MMMLNEWNVMAAAAALQQERQVMARRWAARLSPTPCPAAATKEAPPPPRAPEAKCGATQASLLYHSKRALSVPARASETGRARIAIGKERGQCQ